MPYITPRRRDALQKMFAERGTVDLLDDTPQNAGELNYIFTIVASAYLKQHGTSYQTINDVMGALEGAKLEFYRRIAAPYEAIKLERNGDVY